MRSFVRLSGGRAAVALTGVALTGVALTGVVLAAAAPAALAREGAAQATVIVPCSTSALTADITAANTSLTPTALRLAPDCTYSIFTPATVADGLPVIVKDITLTGGPSTVIRRSPFAILSFRILEVGAVGTLTVNGVSIMNGRTLGLGGGILNNGRLTVSQSTLTGNTAGNGGALANSALATASVSSTLIQQNTTTGVGGGGIINFGRLTLFKVILNANTAPVNGGGLNTQPGGISTLFQSTVTNNTSGGLGGGISNLGTTSINGSQIRLNTGSGGGGIATGNTNVTLTSSIVKKNTPNNCSPLNTIPGCVN